MKKYRLTKITVKTREIIPVSKTVTGRNENPVCPVCHEPLPVFLPAAKPDAARIEEQAYEFTQALKKEKAYIEN